MTEPPIIDHNPNEKRPPKWFWWAVFGVIGLVWIGQGAIYGYDWGQLCLGIATGGLFVGWAMDYTGGETPASWRKPARRR